jgi:hypothetical protein
MVVRSVGPSPLRLAAAGALELLALGGLVGLAAASPPTVSGVALAAGAGVLLAVLVYSAWEWAVHRYVYHRVLASSLKAAYLTHHRDHHIVEYPASRFTGPQDDGGSAQAHGSIWQQVLSRLAGRAVTIPDRWIYLIVGAGLVGTAGWFLTRNVFFCAGVAGAGVSLFQLFGRVHGTIHRPGTHPRLEAQPWFPFLARHHYIHHVDLSANQNFLIPLADWACGTLRLSLDDAPCSATRPPGSPLPAHLGDPGLHEPLHQGGGRR